MTQLQHELILLGMFLNIPVKEIAKQVEVSVEQVKEIAELK